jgi:hypothetical protein
VDCILNGLGTTYQKCGLLPSVLREVKLGKRTLPVLGSRVPNELAEAFFEAFEALVRYFDASNWLWGGLGITNPSVVALHHDDTLPWRRDLVAAIQDDSLLGTLLSAVEYVELEASVPPEVDLTFALHHVQRVNRTMASWAAGIFEPNDDLDIISYTELEQSLLVLAKDFEMMRALGYVTLVDWYLDRLRIIEADLENIEAGICGKVSVRIDQRLVLTRSAFNAELTITNDDEVAPVTNVSATILIRRSDDRAVIANDVFVVDGPTVEGFGSDGLGGLAVSPMASATLRWLMIPLPDAAPTRDAHFDISGRFSFNQAGIPTVVPLYQETITVKPDPRLFVRYFWETDVYGDDPFTEERETPVPFTIAAMVINRGYGSARTVTLSTSQPAIAANEKGVLIDFTIVGTQVQGQPVAPSLNVAIGEVSPVSTKSVRWIMTSTLSGRFIGFNATFQHVSELGDPRLSLLEGVEVLRLKHTVRVDYPYDDGQWDFLVDAVSDLEGAADAVHTSGDEVYDVFAAVADVRSVTILSRTDIAAEVRVGLTYLASGSDGPTPPSVSGMAYIRFPVDTVWISGMRLVAVQTSTGRWMHADNFWRSTGYVMYSDVSRADPTRTSQHLVRPSRGRSSRAAPVFSDDIHLFDTTGVGESYILHFAVGVGSVPSVWVEAISISSVTLRWTPVGSAEAYVVEARGDEYVYLSYVESLSNTLIPRTPCVYVFLR